MAVAFPEFRVQNQHVFWGSETHTDAGLKHGPERFRTVLQKFFGDENPHGAACSLLLQKGWVVSLGHWGNLGTSCIT